MDLASIDRGTIGAATHGDDDQTWQQALLLQPMQTNTLHGRMPALPPSKPSAPPPEAQATTAFNNVGSHLAKEAHGTPTPDAFGLTPAQEELKTLLQTYPGAELDGWKDAAAAAKADLSTPGGKAVAQALGISDATLVPPPPAAPPVSALNFDPFADPAQAASQQGVEAFLDSLRQKSSTFQTVLDNATANGAEPISFKFGATTTGFGAEWDPTSKFITLDPTKLTSPAALQDAAVFELNNAANTKAFTALSAEAHGGAFEALAKDMSIGSQGPTGRDLFTQNYEAVEWYGTQTQHQIFKEASDAGLAIPAGADVYAPNYTARNGAPARWADFDNYLSNMNAARHNQSFGTWYDAAQGGGNPSAPQPPLPKATPSSTPADFLPTDAGTGNPKVTAAATSLETEAGSIAATTRGQIFKDIDSAVATRGSGGASPTNTAVRQADAAVEAASRSFAADAVATAKSVAKTLGKAAPVINVALLTKAVYDDVKSGDTDAHETRAALGGIGGSVAGAQIGAIVGTAILPGVGTLIGGLLGGVAGGVGGAIGASASVFDGYVSSAVKVVQNVAGSVGGTVSRAGETIGQFLDNATQGLGKVASGAVGWLSSWFAPAPAMAASTALTVPAALALLSSAQTPAPIS